MFRYVPSFGIIVVLLVCIADADPPKLITYTCEGGKVKPSSINVQNGDKTKIRVMMKSGNFCTETGGEYLNTCVGLSNLENVNNGYTLKIVYEDESKKNIIGGQNSVIFVLTCNEKAGKMIVKASMTNVEIPATAASILEPNISATPEMKIENDPPTIYIGDTIKLNISVKGNYRLNPLSCLANYNVSNVGYTFWDKCKNELTDNAIMKDAGWTTADNGKSFTADIFAFRFAGSSKVNIKCTIYVCPGKTTCSYDCSSDGSNRRKRDSMNLLKSRPLSKSSKAVATVSFAVQSYKEQSNSAHGMWFGYRYTVIAWISSWTISRFM